MLDVEMPSSNILEVFPQSSSTTSGSCLTLLRLFLAILIDDYIFASLPRLVLVIMYFTSPASDS